ncbi:MAG: hypothetical protein OXG15_00080 [Gammaproteobacteria bacterium]|nr:hypothetical protein [Gammaproteobacteria bacterium]
MDDNKFSYWKADARKIFDEDFRKEMSKKLDNEKTSGYMYIRHLVFMNGGALVAILSSRAVLLSNQTAVEWTWWPMVCFAAGLTLTVFLNGFVHLQHRILGRKWGGFHISFMNDKISYTTFKKGLSRLGDREELSTKIEVSLGSAGLTCFIAGAILGFCQLA